MSEESKPNQPKKRAKKSKDIPRLERPKVFTEAFLAFPTDTPYGERVKALATHFKVSEKNIYQTAARHKWRERLQAITEAKKQQEAFEQTLIDVAPTRQDIPNSVIARSIKDLSHTLLAALQRVVRSSSFLIEYYGSQIAALVASKGGYGFLSTEDLQQVATWQAQVTAQAKNLEPYLKPSSISSLLEQTNFRMNLPQNLEDVDASAFTVFRLQEQLMQLGMTTAFGLAGQGTFAPFSNNLPDDMPDLERAEY